MYARGLGKASTALGHEMLRRWGCRSSRWETASVGVGLSFPLKAESSRAPVRFAAAGNRDRMGRAAALQLTDEFRQTINERLH
jgi:hypothetical protein